MTIQETLVEGFQQVYPSSVVKKLDKDNFLDIHIPSLNPAKATHLFFNTPKTGIKIGFYCRDEEFVKATLKKSKKLESYSQGIRLKDNPVFENAELAIKAAVEMVNLMSGEKTKKEVKPKAKSTKKPQANPATKKAPKVVSEPKISEPKLPIPPIVEKIEPKSVGFWQWLIRLFK